MRSFGPDAVSVVGPSGVLLFDFFRFGIQLYCWVLIIVLSHFYILIFMYLEMIHG